MRENNTASECGQNISCEKLLLACEIALEMEKCLAEKGLSFLTKEGLIFCRSAIYSGSIIKVIINDSRTSIRAAHLALEKIEEKGFVTRSKSDTDKRATVINFVNKACCDHFLNHSLFTSNVNEPAKILA